MFYVVHCCFACSNVIEVVTCLFTSLPASMDDWWGCMVSVMQGTSIEKGMMFSSLYTQL